MGTHTAIGAALLVAFLGVGSTQAGAETMRRPVLRLVDKQPVTLNGLAFKAHERVRVTIKSDEFRRTRTVRATRRGAFAVEFDVRLGRCSGLFATASGSLGSRAAHKLPQPQCPPPLQPRG
jgi:hypothetical protein